MKSVILIAALCIICVAALERKTLFTRFDAPVGWIQVAPADPSILIRFYTQVPAANLRYIDV